MTTKASCLLVLGMRRPMTAKAAPSSSALIASPILMNSSLGVIAWWKLRCRRQASGARTCRGLYEKAKTLPLRGLLASQACNRRHSLFPRPAKRSLKRGVNICPTNPDSAAAELLSRTAPFTLRPGDRLTYSLWRKLRTRSNRTASRMAPPMKVALPEGVDAQQAEAVADHFDQRGADQRADRRADTAGQAGAADDGRGDDLEFQAGADVGGDRTEPAGLMMPAMPAERDEII